MKTTYAVRSLIALGLWMGCLRILPGAATVAKDVGTASSRAASQPMETHIFRLVPGPMGGVELHTSGVTLAVKGPKMGQGGTIEDFLLRSGVPWPEGSNITYHNKTDTLIVTNTPTNMVLIRELVALWSEPAFLLEVEAKFVVCGMSGRFFPELVPSDSPVSDAHKPLSMQGFVAKCDFEPLSRAIEQDERSDLLATLKLRTINGKEAQAALTLSPKSWEGKGLRIILAATPMLSADGMITLTTTLDTSVLREKAEGEGSLEAEPGVLATRSTAARISLENGETVIFSLPLRAPNVPDSTLAVFLTTRIVYRARATNATLI